MNVTSTVDAAVLNKPRTDTLHEGPVTAASWNAFFLRFAQDTSKTQNAISAVLSIAQLHILLYAE
jgi:hypothetical protein